MIRETSLATDEPIQELEEDDIIRVAKEGDMMEITSKTPGEDLGSDQ